MSTATLDTTTVRGWKRYPEARALPLDWALSIPSHWATQRLKEVASVRPSNVDKKAVEGERAVRLCNYVDVYKNDQIIDDMEFMEATATDAQIAQFSIRAGDVIITKDSETWDDIAVPAYVPQTIDGLVCGYHLALIRPDSRCLDGAYLARCFAAEGLCDQFRVAANGITRYGLDTQSIKGAVFPVPPLSEQREIAAFLDRETARIDALIGHKERLIELLEEKRQAGISHAVTRGLDPNVPLKDSGVPWLGMVPKHWEVQRIKWVAKLESGHTPDKKIAAYWTDCDIPWVSLNDTGYLKNHDYISDTEYQVNQLGLANSSARLLPARAVVFSRDATIGRCAITTRPMAVSQHFIAWLCRDSIIPEYLLRVLRAMQQDLERLTMGATIKTIGMPDVRTLATPVPPVSEQMNIVRHIETQTASIDKTLVRIRDNIGLLQEHRTALISAAVTGQIDVRGEVTP